MDDLISRQAAIEAIDGALLDSLSEGIAIEILSELPSAQQEIIRCKDCKYGEQDDHGWWYCRDTGYSMGDGEKGDGFCSNAERRRDG